LVQEAATEQNHLDSKLNVFILMDMLSKWSGILDSFEKFPVDIQTNDSSEKHSEKKFRRKVKNQQ